MAQSIDFQAIRSAADLESVITADLGPPVASGKWLCPFHGDTNPSLGLTPDGQRWKCWACEARGDVLDFVAKREGISVVEAARRLDPAAGHRSRHPGSVSRSPATPAVDPSKPKAPPASSKPPAWQDAGWQGFVDLVVREGEQHLWKPVGSAALEWLRGRGLMDSTISRFRLGFIPAECWTDPLPVLGQNRFGRPRKMQVPRGITIPWGRPGSWYSEAPDPNGADPGPRWVGCNVRRLPFGDVSGPLSDGPKYLALAGSERGHAFPFADVVPDVPALVCEGEFDALLAWQEAGHVANVLTVGGVAQNAKPDALAALEACPGWALAFDHDRNHAGDIAAWKFAELGDGKSRRLWLPRGNDLTDFHKAGGDIPDWLASEWSRFGWPWPIRPA